MRKFDGISSRRSSKKTIIEKIQQEIQSNKAAATTFMIEWRSSRRFLAIGRCTAGSDVRESRRKEKLTQHSGARQTVWLCWPFWYVYWQWKGGGTTDNGITDKKEIRRGNEEMKKRGWASPTTSGGAGVLFNAEQQGWGHLRRSPTASYKYLYIILYSSSSMRML